MNKYAGVPDGATKLIAHRGFKCAACGKTTERKMRGQRFCSRRCRQRANYADKVARGDFLTPNTALPTTAHKSASNINELQGAKRRPSPYAPAPLNILGGGSFRWPGRTRLDAGTLENILRSEIGAAP
jgi:predicted nucleic acid-binding Zn ribbon protein